MNDVTYLDLAKMIDHSLLQPTLTDADMEAGIAVAIEYQVASICIKPYYVARCAQLLAGSGVKTSTVIGFPHGGNVTSIKAAESVQAIKDGKAVELDMVCNIGKVLSKDWAYVSRDIKAVVDVAHQAGAKGEGDLRELLPRRRAQDRALQDLRRRQCRLGEDLDQATAATGAIDEDLEADAEGDSPAHVQVKAAGGVRDFDRLMAVRKIGVTRVGATATKAILDGARRRHSKR